MAKEKNENEVQKFKMNELVGEAFKAYKQAELKLSGTKMVEYYKVNATAKIRKFFDDNLRPQQELDGIVLVKEKPICKTKIEPAVANRLNEQIYGSSAYPETSFYYLAVELVDF